MATIFTKIINKEIPCYKITENEFCISFLDISPLTAGHALVIPKKEVDYYFDLEDELLFEVNKMAKRVAKAIEKTVACSRVGVAVIGLEVPHAHVHLVPINEVGDINFKKKRVELSDEEFKSLAKKIASNL